MNAFSRMLQTRDRERASRLVCCSSCELSGVCSRCVLNGVCSGSLLSWWMHIMPMCCSSALIATSLGTSLPAMRELHVLEYRIEVIYTNQVTIAVYAKALLHNKGQPKQIKTSDVNSTN